MQARWMHVMCLAVLPFSLSCAAADNYPVRPIRVLAGGAAGGPIDIMARVVGQKLADVLKQSIVVDNRGGAGGTIATRLAAQAVPDGYTLLCNSSQYVAAASLYKDPGYDPFKDFHPIINAGVSPNMIFVHPSVAANTLQELIALGKKQKLSYGSSGAGSTPHLTGERLLKLMVGLGPADALLPLEPRLSSARRVGRSELGHNHRQPCLIKQGCLDHADPSRARDAVHADWRAGHHEDHLIR